MLAQMIFFMDSREGCDGHIRLDLGRAQPARALAIVVLGRLQTNLLCLLEVQGENEAHARSLQLKNK